MFMLLLQRWWLHLAIAVVFSVAGYQVHRATNKADTTTTKETLTQSKQLDVKTEITKAQSTIDRVTTKTVNKEGKPRIVVKERITTGPVTEVTTSQSKVETKAIKETKTVVASQNISRYSLGLAIAPTRIMQPRASDVVIEAGIRLGNLPLWATASGSVAGMFVVGVRYEF